MPKINILYNFWTEGMKKYSTICTFLKMLIMNYLVTNEKLFVHWHHGGASVPCFFCLLDELLYRISRSIRSLRLRFRTVAIAIGLVHSLGWQCKIVCMRMHVLCCTTTVCVHHCLYSRAILSARKRLCSCR